MKAILYAGAVLLLGLAYALYCCLPKTWQQRIKAELTESSYYDD